jgi:hypothetical protein
MKKIEKAPDDSVKRLEMIIDYLYYKVLHMEGGYLVTDESYFNDFRMFRDDNCKQVDGQWIKTIIQYDKEAIRRDYGSIRIIDIPKKEIEKYCRTIDWKISADSISWNKDVLDGIKNVFDISLIESDLKLKVHELAYKISNQISLDKRQEILKNHSKLF